MSVRKHEKRARTDMKARFSTLALLPFLLFAFSTAFSEQKAPRYRVGYVPFVHAGEDMRYEIICGTATDTLELKLGMVPFFEVVRITNLDPYKRYDLLKDQAKKQSLDYVLFGKAGPGRSGEVVFQMSVFDKGRNAVSTTREETAGTIFNVFGAAERLVANVVKDFSGLLIAFGAVELVNTGEEGDYDVYVDSNPLGKNVQSSRKIFCGNRLFEVRQKRMLGPEVLYSKTAAVTEGGETKIEFAVPYLTERERAHLQKLEGTIESLKDDRREKGTVMGIFSDLLSLFQDVSYCKRLAEERERIRQKEVEYRLQAVVWEIEDTLFEPGQETFEILESIWDSRGSYADPSKIEGMVTYDSQYFFEVLQLHALYEFSQGNWERGTALYRFMERIERKVPLRDTGNFEEEKRFVYKTWKKYSKKSERGDTFPEIMMGVKLGRRFGDRIQSAERFFREPRESGEKELIVLTCPSGMTVTLDGKKYGSSPLRVHGIRKPAVEVAAEGPSGRAASETASLGMSQTFLFLRSDTGERISVHQPEKFDRGRTRLSWSEVPDVKSYRVQVDTADGDFSKPFATIKGVKKPFAVLDKKLKNGVQYVYRVKAIHEEGAEGSWGYSAPFAAE
jgi:hypothetical protein